MIDISAANTLLIPATLDLVRGWRGPVVIDRSYRVLTTGELLSEHLMCAGGAYPLATVSIDLALVEARTRTMAVMGERLVGPVPPRGQGWTWRCDHYGSNPAAWELMSSNRNWVVWCEARGGRSHRPGVEHMPNSYTLHVPELALLDGGDDRPLLDGSRLVDARALGMSWAAAELDRLQPPEAS